jgi:hypothetical protein
MGGDQDDAVDPSQHHVEESDHNACRDGGNGNLIRNRTSGQKGMSIGICRGLKSAAVPMKENSIATLVWDYGRPDWLEGRSKVWERFIGGQRGTRTPDILLVRQAL